MSLYRYPQSDADTGMIRQLSGAAWEFLNTGDWITCGDYSTDEWRTFVRLPNITIPQGTTIYSATIWLYITNYWDGDTVNAKVYFEKALNPSAISSVSDYNARVLTTAYTSKTFNITANPDGWIGIDMTSAFQEIIAQSGWEAGNAIQVLIKPESSSNAAVHFDSTYAGAWQPQIGISYYGAVPDAPSGITATRVSDTSQTINWTNNPASGKPYTYLKVERSEDGVNYSQLIGALANTTTSYTDTSTQANKSYYYRVRAWNYYGNSAYNTMASPIKTTPSAVSNVVAVRSGSSVVITWDNNSPYADNIKIEKSQSPYSSWSTLDLGLSGNATTKTDTSPYTYVKYRVWSSVTANSLDSAKVLSNECIEPQAPSAPTNLSPTSLIDVAIANTFTWQHNPLDTSGQTKYSIQYKVSGGSYPGTPQVNEATGTASSHEFAAATFTTNTTYYYQVKTWGGFATGSSWSAEANFTTGTKPTLTIDQPSNSSVYGYSVLTANWTFNDVDSNTQTQAIINLYNSSDELLESNIVYGAIYTKLFERYLTNATNYYITIQVLDSSGLWSNVYRSDFTTSFYLPARPILDITYIDADGTASIKITNPAPSGTEIGTSYQQLYRSYDGITYELLSDNIPENTTIIDYLPLLHGTTYYYVTAMSVTPTTINSYVEELIPALTGIFFINSGILHVKIMGDVSYDEQRNRKQTSKQFEGRIYPVKFMGVNKDRVVNFSCDLPFADYDDLVEIIEGTNDIYYRDWKDRLFCCSLINCKFAQKDPSAYQFSCVITQVEI